MPKAWTVAAVGILTSIGLVAIFFGTISATTKKGIHFSGDDSNLLAYHEIVLVGDSLTEYSVKPGGWGLQMITEYSRKMSVSIRGFASYNTHWLKLAIKPILLGTTPNPSRIKLITLLLGTNDYVNPSSNKHVPLDLYIKNMREIIATMQSTAPNAKILVLTPPPMSVKIVYDGEQTAANPNHYATLENAKLYRDACAALVLDLKKNSQIDGKRVEVLDTWDLFIPNHAYDKDGFDPLTLLPLFADTRHFNEQGNTLLFKGIVGKIASVWPALSASNQNEVLPTNWIDAPSAMSGDEEGVKNWLFGL
ncbi:UNVERIFIED_CONTAM: hypothetical protein HDU68_010811 [Siphonaria sp. JEL0065]|nr:hypothetical protein HDU68_010811 [Siphonaria sp. JEL0065]